MTDPRKSATFRKLVGASRFRPADDRLRDTSKEYRKGYKQQYQKMLNSFYPNDYG